MTATTPIYGFPYPLRSDPPDVAVHVQNLATAVENQLADTDANVAAINVTRSALRATLLGSAAYVIAQPSTNPVGTASTGFVYARDSGGAILAGSPFVAPPSGVVSIRCGMCINPVAGTATVAPQVLTGSTVGSGTAVLTAADAVSYAATGSSTVPGAREVSVSGLTPGTQYNAGLMWHSSSTGITIAGSHPWLSVTPEL
jgi:hypothetical protein